MTARVLAGCIFAPLVGLVGCSAGGPEYGLVEGRLTLNGKPLPNVEVVFMPDPEKGTRGTTASAYTDDQGRYRLWCESASRPGAPVGTYRVCLHDISAMPPPPESVPLPGEKKFSPPKTLRIPSGYYDVSRTPLQNVQVQPGAQSLDFDVKLPGR